MSWAPGRFTDRARTWRGWLLGGALAIAAPGVATALSLALQFEDRPGAAALYLLATFVATYLGGLWVGLYAVGLSLLGMAYFFVNPSESFVDDWADAASLAVSFVGGLLIVAIVDRERRALRALREAERRLELTLEETATGFRIWDAVEDRFLWSPNLGPLFGLPRGARPGSYAEFRAFVHPDDAERVADADRRLLAGEDQGELEFRIVTGDGETRWLWNQSTAERDRDGRLLRVLGLTRDITERKRAEEADRFLAEASELLGRSLDVADTLEELARLVVPRLADWCAVELLPSKRRAGFTTFVHLDPEKRALAERLTALIHAGDRPAGPRRAAIETGRSQLIGEAPDELVASAAADGEQLSLLRQEVRSAVVSPLTGPDGVVGVLTLVDAQSGRRFGEPEVDLVEELARRAGSAIANADLHAAERAARDAAEAAADRTSRLQRITAALAGAATPREVAEALVSLGTPAFEGAAAWVGFLADDRSILVAEAEVGWPPEFRAILDTVSLAGPRRPLVEAARSGRPVWLGSGQELSDRYPDIAGPYRRTGFGAVGVVPISTDGVTTGVFLVSRPHDNPFTAVDRAFLLTLAAQAGQALERARAHAAEEELRSGIERVLDVAPAWLGGSPTEVARAVCRSAVETFAVPVCHLLDVLDESLRVVWREPVSDDRPPGREFPLDNWPGLRESLAQLRPMFVRDVQAPEASPLAGGAGAHALATGLRSSLRLPVSVGGRAKRVLILTWTEVVAPPSAVQLAVMRRFADQAALALEQAERVEAEAAAARSAERLERLQTVTASLAGAASVREIARTILDHLESFGGRAGAVAIVREPERTIELVDAAGYPRELVERFRRFPVDSPLPLAEAVRTREPVVVDAVVDRDARFPETRGIRSPTEGPLVAVPLALGERAVGAIGVHLVQPGAGAGDELALLESLGRLAAQAVERAQLYEREQAVAATLQGGVLPDSLPQLDAALVAARYLPGSPGLDVGGDWYDVVPLVDEQVVLAVGDVVGKGVGAASTMAQLRNALRAYVLEGFGAAAVLGRLNRMAELTELHFATLLVAVVDLRTGECRYTSAGHPPPLVVPPDGASFFAEGGGSLPLGVSRETEYVPALLALEPGATLVLYTDGLVESRRHDLGEALDRLRAAAQDGPEPLELLVDHLVERAPDDQPLDDVAVLALRLLATPSAGLSLSFPASPDALVELRTSVLAWLDTHGCDQEAAQELTLACWELCANAIEHALDRRRAVVEVTGELVRGAISLTVRDHGGWREPRPTPGRGLGLRLAAGLSDDVSVRPGLDGTRVTLTRRLRSAISA